MGKVTLTRNQNQVVRGTEGPLLVIAGPGSGKTFTLVERVANLVAEKSIPPERIMVATFTEKAAAELITRITHKLLAQNVVVNLNEMYVGTLHSICLRILEEHREFTRLRRNFTLMDQFDQNYFIFQKLKEFEKVAPLSLLFGARKIAGWKKALLLTSWINKLTEEVITPQILLGDSEDRIVALGKWYALYLDIIERDNLLDFSTIQLETLRLLEEQPEKVLAPLREKLQYIMIDEYQDTNTIQERLILTLAGDEENLCVVGDDDQGLYRFRGATIRNILEFPQQLSGKCAQYTLATNFRSDPGIIRFYNQWMEEHDWTDGGQQFRFAKNIEPPKDKEGVPHSVIKVAAQNGSSEWHDEVLKFLLELKDGDLEDWNQVAFLFRSVRNQKVQALAAHLEENGVPVYSPRSNLFFDRPEIRLIIGAFMGLFRTAYTGARDTWEKRGISLGIWDYYDQCFVAFAQSLRQKENSELKAWWYDKVLLVEGMTKPLDKSFSDFFYGFLQFPLFATFLNGSQAVMNERPARNLAIFSQLLAKFEYLHNILVLHPKYLEKNVSDFFNHFLRYVYDGGRSEFEDDADYAPRGCVSFMTVHQAKGLEFPVTVVGSLEAVPRKQYSDLDELLQANYFSKKAFEPWDRIAGFDFKRLFYTAFSRAKNLLVLTSPGKVPHGKGQRKVPSKYFLSHYAELPNWRDVDLRQISFDPVQAPDLKRQYSYTSHVLVYEGCPRQYQFFKHWEFMPVKEGPMLFGTLVHQTIEDVHKAVLRDEVDKITSDNIELWFDVNYAALSQKERIYLAPRTRQIALGHVLRYVARKGARWDDIRETEVEVSLVKDDYILMGQIDLVQGEGNTVEVVDFKSERKPDIYAEREKVNRYKRQLEIYAHLVEERYGLNVSRMHLYYTGEDNGVPTISFPYDKKAIDKTIGEVDNVVSCMEGGIFALQGRPPQLCKECDLKSYCDRE